MSSEIQTAAGVPVDERTNAENRRDGLWIDDPAADAIRRSPRGFLRRHTADLVERGVTLIEGAVTPELCDELREDYERFCEDQPPDVQVRDANGHRIRLANFQTGSDAARRIARNPKVMELVDHVLGSRGVIYTSLLFDVGTEQVMHRDTPYFFTDPPGRFVGVWTALEDVRPEAGPLMYYEGGHRVPDAEVVLEAIRAYPGEHGPVADLGGARYATYNATVERRCQELGLKRVDRTLSKGDTLIWHPMLPHGGAPIIDPAMTRTSIVFHVIAQGATMRPVDEHLALGPVTPSAPLEVIESEGREFVDHGYAHFQVGD